MNDLQSLIADVDTARAAYEQAAMVCTWDMTGQERIAFMVQYHNALDAWIQAQKALAEARR